MAENLTLKILTPERVVLEKQVEQITVRSVDGELSILPGHEPIVTALAMDILRYRFHKDDEVAAVMGGILAVANNEVTVLSDAAELDTEIDVARAHLAKEKAEAEKIQKTDKLDVYITEMAVSRAIARLKAVEYKQRRRSKQMPT